MHVISDSPTDILSLYSSKNDLINDCSYIKSLLKNIPALNSEEDFADFFDACFLECSYVLPEDCHINHFKYKYIDLYLILYEACILTSLSTIENLQHSNKIILALNAYRNFPYKKTDALENIYSSEKKRASHTIYEPKKKATGNEKNAREAFIEISHQDGGLYPSDYSTAPNACISRYTRCQEGLSPLLNCFEITDSQKGSNQNDRLRYLYLTNLSWQVNLLRHGEYNKNGYPNLIKQAQNMKNCLKEYHSIHSSESVDTLPSEVTDKLTSFLKSFINTHSTLIYEFNYFNDNVSFPYQNTDTLMSFQKANLLLAPDIARLINSNLNKDSFLDRKEILSYMIKKITIPFSRDIIIETFLSEGGIINLDVFDTFFDVFYPLLVRVYLFSLLNFPEDENSLLNSLDIVKKKLMNHIRKGLYQSSETYHFHHLADPSYLQKQAEALEKRNIGEKTQKKSLYQLHRGITYDLKACTKNNARSNYKVYGFIHPNQPIIIQHKQYPSLPGKEEKYSLIRLATLISETYGCYPVISKQFYPVQVDESELENLSILVQKNICGTSTDSLRLQYQYLTTINLDHAHSMFNTEDWARYKKKYLCTQEKKTHINETILPKYHKVTEYITNDALNIFELLPNERKEIQQYLSDDSLCSMLLTEINRKYKITVRPDKMLNVPKPVYLKKPYTTRLGT